jgi:endo-1,4-beta-xylanase
MESMMEGLTRRDLARLAVLGGAAAVTSAAGATALPGGPDALASPTDSLDALAKAKGFSGFGSSIGAVVDGSQGGSLSFEDAGVLAIHRRECGILVCEIEMKWVALRPDPEEYTFYQADRMVDWAHSNNVLMRGHTLMWSQPQWFPKWVTNYDFGPRPATEAERLLRDHVTTVCTHFGTRVFTYDVVNEAVNELTGELIETPFTKYLGPEAIDICFDAAHRAAPHAKLVYNDFVSWGAGHARYREGVLRLLSRLKANKAPVDALGVQSHIGQDFSPDSLCSSTFDAPEQAVWKEYLDSASGMGLRLAITEFDVSERGMASDIAERDRQIADFAHRYLDFMFGYRNLDYMMVWGLLDHYSWLQDSGRRFDGMLKRPTPFDDNYQPKPLRQAIAAAFRNAPPRT